MRKLPFLALLLPMALSSQVQAQTEGSSLQLEEIIVTATRRETSLQDTPIAVTALSQTLMEELNINSPFAYESIVPSLTYQQSPNRLSIRGVGRFDNSLGTAPGVAIYNDGIFTAEATSLSTQPINIDRTEILRGPQGTLYGRNTTGGAVNIISRRPTSEFEADLRVKVGEEDLRQFAGVVSGPITDSLRYKLHYIDTERDGLLENTAGPDLNTQDSWYAEGQIEWDITDKLQLWAEYARFEYDRIPNSNWNQSEYNCETFWNGLTKNAQYQACANGFERVGANDPTKTALNAPGKEELNNNNSWTARLSYEFEGAELSYLYGLVEYDYDITTDTDGTQDTTPENQAFLSVGQYQEQSTHELQLISNWDKDWNYVFGLYYFEDQNEQPFMIHSPDNPTFGQSTDLAGNYWDNPLGVIYFQSGKIDNESWAVFGEVDFPLADQWTMALGARFSEDDFTGYERQIRYYNLYREFGGADLPYAVDASVEPFAGDASRYVNNGFDAKYEDDFSNTTGKVTVSYRPGDDTLLWGTVSNGYKMGGTRLGAMEQFFAAEAGVVEDGKFDQEDVISYELGWKDSFMDNTLLTELVAYMYDYDDMQQLRSYLTPPPASISLSQVVNVDTEMWGVEASGTWLVTDNWRAIVTYSYNDTEITSDAYFDDNDYGERDENGDIIPTNVKGNQLRLTPEHKAALSTHYFWPTSIGEFTLGGTYSYMDQRYFDIFNTNEEGSYTRLDLQASWTSNNGRYKVLGLVTNATDEEAFNTHGCGSQGTGTYGTSDFVLTCGGRALEQRLWEVQFMLKL